MCETAAISNQIVSIGTRSYRQRLETLAGRSVTSGKLARLNRDLDNLYELIYSQLNSITEKEYSSFKSTFQELIKSLKALYSTSRRISCNFAFEEEVKRLGRNYSALEELRNDIQTFKVEAINDKELLSLLSEAAKQVNSRES